MVYKRPRAQPRRRLYAKRRGMKRVARPMRSLRYPSITVQRTFYQGSWVPNQTTTDGFWKYYQFTPNVIPNWNDYFNLFDAYKINALKYTFRPRYDNYSGNDTTDTTIPGITAASSINMHVVNDPYSTVVPAGLFSAATFNSFMEQGNVKSYTGNKPFSVYFKPTINISTEAGNNMRRKAGFLNVNLNNSHSGFYIFAQPYNMVDFNSVNQQFDVFITVYMTLRNLR